MLRKISSFVYVFKQGIANVFHNNLFSLASVATISACLFLFGIFYTIVMNFEHMVMKAEEGVSVTVFFHSEYDLCYRNQGFQHREEYVHPAEEIADEERLREIGREIAAREEVSSLKFTSDEEAWSKFGPEYFGEDYASGYEDNPLKGENTYEVFLRDVALQDDLVNWLNSLPEVRKVNYDESTATKLTGANLLIAYISAGIIVILFAVSIFLISNTVAVGIAARSQEINIMKYVGATDFFARSPFVIEGMFIGAIGAVIPLIALYFMYQKAMEYITVHYTALSSLFDFLSAEKIFSFLLPACFGLGIGMGFLGSVLSVRKHLKV
ncbi:MAG: permease-like cell division protein FtsX [Lachnospiraceae bacterium]|nr:permease-like cell division protein FtsX [Lachnospiraceae bacterium]